MSLGIRSRTKRPAYEETSEHFQVRVALPWSAEKPNVPLSSPALATRVRPCTQTLNTGTSEASVMWEDRDRVDFSYGTLSMITGPSLRGLSHLDDVALQASYERSVSFLHAHTSKCSTKSFMQANQLGQTQNPLHRLLFEVDQRPKGFL